LSGARRGHRPGEPGYAAFCVQVAADVERIRSRVAELVADVERTRSRVAELVADVERTRTHAAELGADMERTCSCVAELVADVERTRTRVAEMGVEVVQSAQRTRRGPVSARLPTPPATDSSYSPPRRSSGRFDLVGPSPRCGCGGGID
jgi:hypothetical protein